MHVLSEKKNAKKFFDIISCIYDVMNPFIYSEEMRSRLRNEIEGGVVLDVGVGTGYTSCGLRSIGIDISEKMLSRFEGLRVLSDGQNPPFKENSFSTIICAGSFYYLEDPVLALHNFHGLLQDYGVFLSISPTVRILSPFVHVYSEKDFRDFFSKTGFVLEKAERMRWYALFVKARRA